MSGRVKSDSYCSSVKSHLHCDVQSPACRLLPIVPAASLHSQAPSPFLWSLDGRAPKRTHSRSDSGPPRCSRQHQLHTTCSMQVDVRLLDSTHKPCLPLAHISPARPGTGWIQLSGHDGFSSQRVNGDQGEQRYLFPFLLFQKNLISFFCGLSFFFLREAEQLMLQQDK